MTRIILPNRKDRKPLRWSVIFLVQAAIVGAIALAVSDSFNGASLLAVVLVFAAFWFAYIEETQQRTK